ncbi:regucalcin-like [Oppia nitens]|uniref:regucalcin-like n=1 Tax=Oppia nitens TaxID=1686743 RepID=UPI0023D9D717|nr:regucalcin-like [Oppia nitens]
MAKYTVEVISNHVCQLGEGPHWDQKSQTLYYVDLLNGDVCRLYPKTKESEINHIGEIVSVLVPINNNDNDFIIGQNNKLFKFNWNTKQLKQLAEVEKDLTGNRLNDGKCDASGRFWVGSMGPESSPGVVDPDRGSLYSYGNELEKKFETVNLSNGIAWSLDNKIMYFIDSTKRLIYSFDYDINNGSITNEKIFFDFNKRQDLPKSLLPDGMTIDKSGNLWVACFNGSRIININTKTGDIIDTISLPTSCITSVCFGGQDLNQLFVTTASKPLDAQRRAEEPTAGHLFRITSDSPAFGGLDTSYRFNE